MNGPDLYALLGAALFAMSLYSLVVRADPLRRILSLNVMGVGVFMVLVATAADSAPFADPVPHAMVLTGIVVAVCATAFALALTVAREGAE